MCIFGNCSIPTLPIYILARRSQCSDASLFAPQEFYGETAEADEEPVVQAAAAVEEEAQEVAEEVPEEVAEEAPAPAAEDSPVSEAADAIGAAGQSV